MKFVRFYTRGAGDPIYINPEQVSCVFSSDKCFRHYLRFTKRSHV